MLIRQLKATLVVGQGDNILQVNYYMKANKCTRVYFFFFSKFRAISRCQMNSPVRWHPIFLCHIQQNERESKCPCSILAEEQWQGTSVAIGNPTPTGANHSGPVM